MAILATSGQVKLFQLVNILKTRSKESLRNIFLLLLVASKESHMRKKKTLCYVLCKNASFLGSVPRFEKEMTSKWLYLFEGSGVAYGPINDMKNVFTEPQVWFLKFLVHGS